MDYARFLNYATERLLLQRVGGRYRFMHDLVRESLAQRRIDTHPHLISSQVFFRCGESYRLMERYEEALQDFNRAIELDPKYEWAIASRGYTYGLMERYEEALQDSNRAIELNPKYDCYRYLRALIYLVRPQPDLAKADLDTAIYLAQQKYTQKPEDCRNILNLALYHLIAGNLPTAKEFYQTALQQTASQTEIRDAIQYLKDLLRVFPKHTPAQEAKTVLEKTLSVK
ncbi:MAG: tetratricopeptide repeat protein [Iphinoe sp. HA4291-MV1]|nr:tetratricopeptide repeat protein [Iphinoe sp. HA4291-MV1]